MNLLIVDDISTNRKLLRVTLEAEGHTAREAADGVEALQILARESIDAVISDILMPNMDGYRLCCEVRKDSRFSHLPFIVYTATYTSPSDEKLCVDIGADRFIRKPASTEAIIGELNEVIATGRRSPAGAKGAIDEMAVMKEYSERLVAKLEERTIELEQRIRLAALAADVGTALTHGNSLREILQHCSEAFVQHLDAAFARIWTHNERENVLELQASAGMYTHIEGPHGRVPVGKFKIGLIAEERKPHLTNSVIGDPRVPEQEWARREGLVAFAGYPLIIGDRVVGVMAMFARHSLSQATLDAMASITDGVALGIERKRAEFELEQTHNRLLAVSRQAGMAEFATGVLHNVGNVLSSVNVATACLSDSIRKSKSTSLSKLVALMREHETDLGAFFSHDPKGKQVPSYLAQLAEHLAGEQTTALMELGELQKNIEHIENIITAQQDSAKMSRLLEAVKLIDLVGEALKMNANGLQRGGIRVVKEFENIPPIVTEKHMVLQILVNLVRNAMQACEASSSPEKRLTVRVSQEADRVRIAVADNGSGILPENLSLIFAQGFTTKKDGHGFGLHSAALTAEEMGGSLTVQSDGPGRGATFTLELPMKC